MFFGHLGPRIGIVQTPEASCDFFGSLRNPPAFNNVFGFRPSGGARQPRFQ